MQTIMAVWHASHFNKSAPNGLYYLQQDATPNQITQQNNLQQREGEPKSSHLEV
jgi:hypothetical protein